MQAPVVVDRAFRIARTRLQPTVIVLPHDVQAMPMEEPAKQLWVSRSGPGAPSTAFRPPEPELEKAAAILNAGERVALLVGAGARGATEEVLQLAEKTGAGIVTTLRGKQVVPSDIPFHTQHLGLLGTMPSYTMMKECDTLLMLGTNYPYAQFLPDRPGAWHSGGPATGASGNSLPDGAQPLGRREGDAAGAAALSGGQDDRCGSGGYRTR